MIIGIPEILLGLAVIVLPIACLTNWVAALKQYQAGEPLVPTEYRENVPWGLLDLGVVVVIVAVIGNLLMQMVTKAMGIESASLTEFNDPKDQGRVFMVFGICTIIATIFSYTWIYLRYKRLSGFSKYHIGPDIELGMRWFVMLVVPVLLIQVVLTQFFESNHPLTDMMRLTKSTALLPVAAFSAMVAAPIFEESLFRMFLQGWLEKLHVTASRQKLGLATPADSTVLLTGGDSSASLAGAPESDKAPLEFDEESDANPYRSPARNGTGHYAAEHQVSDEQSDIATEAADLADAPNPYADDLSDDELTSDDDVGESDEDVIEERPTMWVPIVVSSGLFALAHLQHGPDWVPLFVLALGLGYLYQRTQRILPCIVVHFLFNTLAILQIWSAVRQ